MTRGQATLKRSFDLSLSIVGLIAFGWLIVLAWALARVDTHSSGFFSQDRVGRHGRIFKVLKLRTMREDARIHTTVTTTRDPRITRLGRLFRQTKIDELPQLINVFKGEMSFVGPRPDVPGFADQLQGEDRLLLTVRPGITGPATLRFRNEEQLLENFEDPENYNREVIYPEKVRINLEYIKNYRFSEDLRIIWNTVTGT